MTLFEEEDDAIVGERQQYFYASAFGSFYVVANAIISGNKRESLLCLLPSDVQHQKICNLRHYAVNLKAVWTKWMPDSH